MRSFSLVGSLLVALLTGASVPALANTESANSAPPPTGQAPTLVVAQSSPAGMQERSHRADVDSDEGPSDDADAQDQSDNDDDVDGGSFADSGRDFAVPEGNDGPYDRGYRDETGPGADGYGPPEGFGDGYRGGQSDEDDDENDDDSGIHQA